MYGKTMINLCVDANSYKQGKPREIHVKRVHNICISHQFPQEGKSLMPVVHYGHKGFSYLRKLMGNESVEAHFSRISLNFSCSYEWSFILSFSRFSPAFLPVTFPNSGRKVDDTKTFLQIRRLSLDFPLTTRESLCIACLSSFRRADWPKCLGSSCKTLRKH